MEAIVVLGFLLLPLLGGAISAIQIFLVAFFLNMLLIKQQDLSKLIHILAIVAVCVQFFFKTKGELGRNSEFMFAYAIGVFLCYLGYYAVLKRLNKLSDEDI